MEWHEIEADFANGLQPERTSLAWSRTLMLLAGVLGLIAVHAVLSMQTPIPGFAIAGCSGIVLVANHALAHRRLTVIHAQLRSHVAVNALGQALALATQERAQLWRATATQVHESVLNSIRYVLTVPHPDTARLAAQVQAEALATQPAPKAPVREAAELLAAVRSAGVDARVQRTGGVPPVAVTADVFDAARSALGEVVRNAVEHGRAATITVRLEQPDPDELSIVVDDDGTGLRGAPTPGIGVQTVLQQSLAGVEGRWTLADSPSGGVQARITVPVIRRKPERRAGGPYRPFDKGRFLVAAPLAGAAMVGSVYFLLLAAGGGPREWLAAVLGLIGIVAAVVLVTRRRRVSRWLGVSLIAAPALVPWTLAGPSYDCSIASGLAPTLNVAGFAVLLIAAWSGYLPGQVGLLVWGSGAAVVLAALPDSCRSDVALAMLNALVVIPVALVATYAGIRVHQRAAARARQARESAITEVSRARAAVDLAAQLEDSVADAVTALTSVARGTPLDAALRHRLELADGRIRAAIQVDPKRAGAFAVLAQALVEEAAASDQAVIVRAVGSSADSRPIPDAVRSALMLAVAESSGTPPVLQAFTDGVEDHLTLLVGPDAARAAGLGPGSGRGRGRRGRRGRRERPDQPAGEPPSAGRLRGCTPAISAA